MRVQMSPARDTPSTGFPVRNKVVCHQGQGAIGHTLIRPSTGNLIDGLVWVAHRSRTTPLSFTRLGKVLATISTVWNWVRHDRQNRVRLVEPSRRSWA